MKKRGNRKRDGKAILKNARPSANQTTQKEHGREVRILSPFQGTILDSMV